MRNEARDFLNRVSWLSQGQQIPSWHHKGIRHGFEGLGYELPPFGVHLKQIHSKDIVDITSPGTEGIVGQGDALFTQLPGHRIAVKTADCVPLLVSHPEGVMAIHAGWRGLVQDIIGASITHLEQKGIKVSDCEWAVGPCISAASFEVGPEVLDAFAQHEIFSAELDASVLKGVEDRWHLDLATIAVLRLGHSGIAPEKISVLRLDTRTHSESLHSYRRDGEKAGRNWSWIELTPPLR